jgi:SNF2 family DNA or RNA helicase
MSIIKNPFIDQYIRNHADSSIKSRGAKIFSQGSCELNYVDTKAGGEANFKVRSDSGGNKYKVNIRGFSSGKMSSSCSCPYDWGNMCKHEVAALYYLDQYLATGNNAIGTDIIKLESTQYKMLDSSIPIKKMDDETLRRMCPDSAWKGINSVKVPTIISVLGPLISCEMIYKKDKYDIRFIKNRESNTVITSCSCNATQTEPLCVHKVASIMVVRAKYGMNPFETFDQNRDAEKNILLAEYGFSITDDLDKKFDFKINQNGKLDLILLDPSIHKLSQFQDWKKFHNRVGNTSVGNQVIKLPTLEESEELITLYAFNKQEKGVIPDINFVPLMGKINPKNGKLSHLTSLLSHYGSIAELPPITAQDSTLMRLAKQMLSAEVTNYLKKLKLISGWYVQMNENALSEEAFLNAQFYVGEVLEKILSQLHDRRVLVGQNNYNYVNQMQEVQISHLHIKPSLALKEDKEFVMLEMSFKISGENIPFKQFVHLSYWLLEHENIIYKIASVEDAALIHHFSKTGMIRVKIDNFGGFFQDFVVPLTNRFDVKIDTNQVFENQKLNFYEPQVFMKEDEEHLMFVPVFVYYENEKQINAENPRLIEFANDGRTSRISYENNKITVQEREVETEQIVKDILEELHPEFSMQTDKPFYYLPFNDVMKEGWLFKFFETLKEKDIPIFGFNQLKKFKYNPNKAKFQIRASSGIDWFDMQMEVHFGDQFVSLNDIKKAVLNKQNYVELKDGSLGMLPDEWLEKYGKLFKFGKIKGDDIRLSKLHFSIIDDLYDQISDEKIQKEIMDKKRKLLNFKEIQNIPLPKNMTATLRDYQVEGYKWLNFLDEFSWGGCLADDMGLGKTVQILTFIQEQKNRNPKGVILVGMPTSLIFNWKAEIEKFCPELKVYVHRGSDRTKSTKTFERYDIILTTYGMLRQDVEMLREMTFSYIILDESQAIKNPDSLVSKAVKLLNTKNRLVMTGTPVENNTFDLYSQMDFLNPGLLGSQEFFRTEYANPIDKNQDKEKAAELRKIIYPFMLKRTKEEVAKDLPDKTESIIFCEMDKKQRKVYDTVRETYRQKIADQMAVVGKEKSGFLILEGLMKLRQICDSPALLSDDAKYPDDSAKLDEIIREIEENASNHKILIFSQFLKMLDLIKAHLEKQNIAYEYLDGKTVDRASKVNHFQGDKGCRVFLMSLKAGGVGLNLTEADYVYLVDPWWNPAVEAQAIDRTHRIGQTKKVFAYKMICKDTIEEKILQLQEKKKDIAKDLISTEAGFIKKLTQNDIIDLFS